MFVDRGLDGPLSDKKRSITVAFRESDKRPIHLSLSQNIAIVLNHNRLLHIVLISRDLELGDFPPCAPESTRRGAS
jgi:hypothetical protein